MRFKWLHVTFDYRNSIESLFRVLKDLTRRFYNDLPSTRMDNLQSLLDVSCSGTTTLGYTRDREESQRR
jgi:hypothetical protein